MIMHNRLLFWKKNTVGLLGLCLIVSGAPASAADMPPMSGQTTTISLPTVTTAPATTSGMATAGTATTPATASGLATAGTAMAPTTAPTGTARSGDRLTLQQCINIALQRNPSIFAAEYAVNAADARVGQAQSAYYPQVGLSGSYSKYSLTTATNNGSQNLYQGNAALTQNIYDFGKTPSQVRVQRLSEDAARSDKRNTVSLVVYGVKQAYYNFLQAEKNMEVAIETVKLTQDQLDQAKGFFDAGVKSRYDVTTAEVNLSNARLAQIRAENGVLIARVTLKNSMGAPDLPDFAIEDTLAFQKTPVTFDNAVERAYVNRPDLQSVLAKEEASKESVSLARTGYYPTLTGNASYTQAGSTFVPEPSGWSAGVTLNIPLFTGFLTTYQVKEAKQNLYQQQANKETLRQGILLDVQQAYLNLLALEEGVGVAEQTVQQAKENYEIATGRYSAGVGSPLDVTSALVGLSNAKTNYIAALANYKIAEAALTKAMGE
jgi:TolC family type I secretion outer membrane protein